MKKPVPALIIVLALALAACASDTGTDAPTRAVENYLQAKVKSDEEAIRNLLCSEMESAAKREAQSFIGVTDARIEDMACKRDEGRDTVTCTGQIVARYGAEDTIFPLTTYRIVQEGGEWKWCGEA